MSRRGMIWITAAMLLIVVGLTVLAEVGPEIVSVTSPSAVALDVVAVGLWMTFAWLIWLDL